jgi:Ca2+-binding EF-hand superfamily protein
MNILNELDERQDIDTAEHFSYNQFYVLYVKFLFLDADQDFRLTKSDLRNFSDADCLTKRMIDRIFAVNLESSARKGNTEMPQTMSFRDWVVFAKAKIGGTACGATVEYWYRVMDLDYDGFVSLADFHVFYLDTVVVLIQVGWHAHRQPLGVIERWGVSTLLLLRGKY